MTTIFERVNTALDTITPAVPFALAPYKGVPLPNTYLAFQLIDGFPAQHADDVEKERAYIVQVSIWCTDGLIALPDVDAAMTAAGFMKSGEHQLPQDIETGHYGLAKEYVYTGE